MKVVPAPGVHSASMVPLCFWMIPYTMDSPSPVPSPGSFVVKNGSKMWEKVFIVYPFARVRYGNSDGLVPVQSGDDRQLSTALHGIGCIDEQIQENFFQS